MNTEVAQKSGAARASNTEPEWSIEEQTKDLELEIEEDDDLYSNMPFTD
jgi:hypothetical protein